MAGVRITPEAVHGQVVDSRERGVVVRPGRRRLRVPPLALLQVGLVVFLLTGLLPASQRAAGDSSDWDITGGHFFTQTGSLNDGLGFALTNQDGVPLWSEFQRL